MLIELTKEQIEDIAEEALNKLYLVVEKATPKRGFEKQKKSDLAKINYVQNLLKQFEH